MKTNLSKRFAASALLVLSTLSLPLITAHAQGTAFTYQGRLQNNGIPASGTYNLTFSLFNVSGGGSAVAGPVTTNGLFITNGLFAVTLDFGPGVFNGTTCWLQIGVETNGAGSFTPLIPRQPLTPTPYAVFAEGANASGISGTIPAANVSGTYGNVVNFNNGADSFDGSFYGAFYGSSFIGGDFVGNFVGTGSSLTDVWHTSGNFGTTAGTDFVGTTDNQPLEFRVNGTRALRLEPTLTNGAVNVIGGSRNNYVASGVVGASIAGGGAVNYSGASYTNSVTVDFGTVGGGYANNANGYAAVVAGGYQNANNGFAGFIGAGDGNMIVGNGGGDGAFLGGGYSNTNGGEAATLVGGTANFIGTFANNASIGGGGANSIIGSYVLPVFGTIAGGYLNVIQTNVAYATIAGGVSNVILPNAHNTIIGGGAQNVILANAINGVIAGGMQNTNSGYASTISGGVLNNTVGFSSFEATVGGGAGNQSTGNQTTIAGGLNNAASGLRASVGGGENNNASGDHAMVPGGANNIASGSYSFAAGYDAFAVNNGAFVWADSVNSILTSTNDNSVTMRASGGYRLFSNSGATAGVFLAPGGASWASVSDRNAKKNIRAVNDEEILDKLSRVPVEQWNYKSESDHATPNLGPMAQDFKAAFYPGRDNRSITTLEFDGVELAAIQGLNEKLEVRSQESESQIAALKAENAELKTRLDKLEQLINFQKGDRK
jgi:Chaperone of endosialidase